MSDMGSYSYVYVIVNNKGEPTLVVQTEREALQMLHEDKDNTSYTYHEVPFKHHN